MRTAFIAIACITTSFVISIDNALAQNLGLPSFKQLSQKKFLLAPLGEYRIGSTSLVCTPPSSREVGIVAVDDPGEYLFLAVNLPSGPSIIANERVLQKEDAQYAVYSFYRECAVHVMGKVIATGPDDSDVYQASLVDAAECLAVIPTLTAFHGGTGVSFREIARRLKMEYGVSSSAWDLARCRDPRIAAETAALELKRR